MTNRKRKYDIIHSHLVSTNDDNVVALSEIMTSSNTSKPNGYQNSSIVGPSTLEHNGATQEPVHRKSKAVSQVEFKINYTYLIVHLMWSSKTGTNQNTKMKIEFIYD